MPEAKTELIEFLDGIAERIRSLEAQAQEALHQRSDESEYRQIMAEKASLLGDLIEEAQPLLDELPPSQAKPVRKRLQRFSESADQAMDLDSVFFMSALLYPDDHKTGEKNDLEVFIDTIREMG